MNYLVIIEGERGNYSAYAPDLPGCITVGETREEIETNMREAIDAYLQETSSRGVPTPPALTQAITISVAA
jgi:predicted RNase H-like HicB family nuclease